MVDSKHQKFDAYERLFEHSFQPIVSAKDNEIHHYEMLLRAKPDYYKDNHDTSVFQYIGNMEKSDNIVDFDVWTLKKAIEKINCVNLFDVNIAVNISGKSLQSDNFIMRLDFLLNNTSEKIKEQLQIEITETIAIKDFETANKASSIINKHGLQLSVDDYGLGHPDYINSQMMVTGKYLENINNLNHLKIEGEHISNMTDKSLSKLDRVKERIFVKNTIELAHEHGYSVIAERVETEEQANLLKEYNADYCQGYYFYKPEKEFVNTKEIHSNNITKNYSNSLEI